MTDQENLARFIMMRSQGWSFKRMTVELDAARTIGRSNFWAASPKNTRNGKFRSKSVKIGKPPLRHVSPAHRLPHRLSSIASARWLCASAPGARRHTRCKMVQKSAIGSKRRLAEPMFLSPIFLSASENMLPPQPPTLEAPSVPSVCSCSRPLFSRRAPRNQQKTRQIATKHDKSRHGLLGRRPLDRFRSDFGPILDRFSAFRFPAFPLSDRRLLRMAGLAGKCRFPKPCHFVPKPARN
jgi:hypothetical protein